MGSLFSIVVVAGFGYLMFKVFRAGGSKIFSAPKIGDIVFVNYGFHNRRLPTDVTPTMKVRVTKVDGSLFQGIQLDPGSIRNIVIFTIDEIASGVSSIQF